jgi:HSP20 family molecular chaperone IbpA
MEKAMNGEIQTAPIRIIHSESEYLEFFSTNNSQHYKNFKPRAWSPPTDLIETADHLIIRIEIAGMNQLDFAIQVEDRHVVVRGCRSENRIQGCYHRMEIPSGEFESEIDLPQVVMTDQINSDYQDGFLVITLTKLTP